MSAKINVSINRFASVSGKRLFFKQNINNKIDPISIPQKDRQYEFVLRFPFEDVDSTEFLIPEGFHLEYIPEKIVMSTSFGKYESEITSDEGKVIYRRKFSLVNGTFNPESYVDYVKFINEVAEADNSKLVLVRST